MELGTSTCKSSGALGNWKIISGGIFSQFFHILNGVALLQDCWVRVI